METKEACPRCQETGGDNSGDNLHNYGEGRGKYCFSCGYTVLSDDEKEKRGIGAFKWNNELEENMSKELITKEQVEQIKKRTGVDGQGSRGITNATYTEYSTRFEYNSDGIVSKHYYAITKDYKASGYKVRALPKEFTGPHPGTFGKDSDLYGQWRFRNSNSKVVILTAGEIDCLSAYQMLEDNRKRKAPDFEPTPVVSSVIGESGSYKQVQKHYDWLNRFEKIIVCYDQDNAGEEATKELAKVLPKGKMYVMDLPLKDCNEMLDKGRSSAFINAYFKARPYTPDGIVASSQLGSKIRELAAIEKIPMPPFMHKLQKLMAGGIPLGRIVNLGAASGVGKSTIVDECVYYWIFNSPHKLGIVSLESEGGEYATKLLSRHIGRKIDLIEGTEDKLKYLNSSYVLEKESELFQKETGEPRFHLIEDRDGGLQSMKNLINNLIISCDVKVIILDPLQDILDGLPNEEQATFMRWMKGLTKSHNVTFININHVRKSQGGQKAGSVGANLFEEDFQGSSAIFKSGACNLIFSRNKEAEDDIEKNTTYMKCSKCRWSGRTGIAGEYYYDNDTHKMFDLGDWVSENSSNNEEDF